MVFKLYRSDFLQTPNEKEQMMKLVNYLDRKFSNTINENCILIIEPHIPEIIGEKIIEKTPDALIIKDDIICILDIKGFYDEIIADCSSGAKWKTKTGEIVQSNDRNPFLQATAYRQVLLNFLNDNNSANTEIINKGQRNQTKWSGKNIYSWIVTGEGSKPSIVGINNRKFPYFKVLPVEQLPQSLTFLGSSQKIKPNEIQHILSTFNAEQVSKNDWHRPDSNEPYTEIGLIPKISRWMYSEDGNDQVKALNRIKELDLLQHRLQVKRCFEISPFYKVRQEALIILINWQDLSLGSIITKALTDSSQEIVDFSLEYLSKNGHQEAFDKLNEMLNNDQESKILKILKAITSTGHPNSCKTLYGFAKKNLFNKPFEQYEIFRQQYFLSETIEIHKERRKEYLETIQEERHITDLTVTMLDCLGEVQCRESVSWIIDIITKPTSIGYRSDDYIELDEYTNYPKLFSSACNALYNIESDDIDISSFLLEKLPTSPEYFQYYLIKLLGMFKVKKAVPLLKPFLEHREDHPEEVAIKALENIGTDEAFDVLQEEYFSRPDSYSGVLICQALRSMNEDKFIDLLLEQINSDNVNDDLKRAYLQASRGSTSLKCTDTLFKLLSNEYLSELAAWNLTFLVDHSDIFKHAMELTWSQNPIEQSGAMWALEKHFIANPNELERFESENTHISVRRALVYFYSDSNWKHKLLKYAKDPDEEIRDIVFRYFTDKKYLGLYIVSSDAIKSKSSMVAIENDFLCIKLNKEILLISKKNIRKTTVSTFNEYYYGVYLEVEKDDSTIEHMILVPAGYHFGVSDYHITTLISEINSENSEKTINESETINTLWENIKELLPKKPRYY